jgi:hypothetical protein
MMIDATSKAYANIVVDLALMSLWSQPKVYMNNE